MLFTTPHPHVARAFYCDVLQGQQVWDETSERGAEISFMVEGTRIDISTGEGEGEPVVLPVLNPGAVAERCWDAGYSVCVREEATGGEAVSVIDPFGRRIDLIP